jgi:hypothetical protein
MLIAKRTKVAPVRIIRLFYGIHRSRNSVPCSGLQRMTTQFRGTESRWKALFGMDLPIFYLMPLGVPTGLFEEQNRKYNRVGSRR